MPLVIPTDPGLPVVATIGLGVALDNLLANTGVADDLGIEWYVTEIDGWDNPAVRLPISERPRADGAFIGDGYYGARSLVVRGAAFVGAGSWSKIQAARVRLAERLDLLRRDALLLVGEDPVPKQLTVRRSGPVRMDEEPGVLRFEVQLVAGDPRKYSPYLGSANATVPTSTGGLAFPASAPFTFGGSASGDAVATNGGTVAAPVVLTITGPITNPQALLVDTGQSLTFGLTLGAGEQLVIDTDHRTVLLGGTASRRNTLLAGSQWWSLAPGVNTVRLFGANAASATLNVAWHDTWI